MNQNCLPPDDASLIAAALANYGGPPTRMDDESQRCLELVQALAMQIGLEPSELVR